MKDIPSSSQYMLNKRRSIWHIRKNINYHITLLIHSNYIIMERQEQYWITKVPSAWWKARKYKRDVKASTSQHEQYGGTVHLFIGTGRSLWEITFMPFTFIIDLYTNLWGLNSLFSFKSVPFSREWAKAPLRVASEQRQSFSRSCSSHRVRFYHESEGTCS